MPNERSVIGWDIGGAHVKACRLHDGEVVDVAQWACPLWQGLEQLERVLQAAHVRWPLGRAQHAVTMTGEMADLFKHREDGVRRIAALVADRLPAPVQFYAGDAGWCGSAEVAQHWPDIASANWLATAQHAALCMPIQGREGVLVDAVASVPGGIAEMCLTAKALQLGVPVVTAFHVTRMVAVVLLAGPLFRIGQDPRT